MYYYKMNNRTFGLLQNQELIFSTSYYILLLKISSGKSLHRQQRNINLDIIIGKMCV
jgi:hypothetical protein